jgi:hypothetical protein
VHLACCIYDVSLPPCMLTFFSAVLLSSLLQCASLDLGQQRPAPILALSVLLVHTVVAASKGPQRVRHVDQEKPPASKAPPHLTTAQVRP